MAHAYISSLFFTGSGNATNPTADVTLYNFSGTQLKSRTVGADVQLQPSASPPRVTVALTTNNSFQHDGTTLWSEPLEFDVDVDDTGDGVDNPKDFEVFFFDALQGPLNDGDELTINQVSLTYSGHPGVVALMQGTGAANSDVKFTLKDGASEILDSGATLVNPVDYGGGQSSISIQSNLEFTNNSGGNWNVDGLLCEAKDNSGTYQKIDDVSFTSVTVGANATLRFTDVTHNFNYP